MLLWLDAQSLEWLTDGARVAAWYDASPRRYVARQSSKPSQPTYRRAMLNGRPVVHFDGADDHLTIAATVVSGNQNRTVFMVARPDAIGSKGMIDLGGGRTTEGAFMVTPEYGVRVSGGYRLWQQQASTSTAAITAFVLNGSTTEGLSAWINGRLAAAADTKVAAINTKGTTIIGGYTAAPSRQHGFRGDIAEIIVYDRALTDMERQSLEQDLARKYGIPVSASTAAAAPSVLGTVELQSAQRSGGSGQASGQSQSTAFAQRAVSRSARTPAPVIQLPVKHVPVRTRTATPTPTPTRTALPGK